MWYAAQSALVAMLQPHLVITGLGGVIAAAVGGVIATVIMRIGKRSTAPRVQPAPAPERRTPPSAGYGETAPPTAPARRLHPGPIALSEPPASDSADDEQPALVATPPQPEATLTPSTVAPILPPTERIAAAWRAEQPPTVDVQHRGLWGRKPFAPPEDVEPPLAFESQQAPIWRSEFLAANTQFEALETFEASPAGEFSPASSAPIWGSWLHAAPHAAPEATDTPSVEPSHEGQAPIWPSFLRPE
jgi:hypothetical protein